MSWISTSRQFAYWDSPGSHELFRNPFLDIATPKTNAPIRKPDEGYFPLTHPVIESTHRKAGESGNPPDIQKLLVFVAVHVATLVQNLQNRQTGSNFNTVPVFRSPDGRRCLKSSTPTCSRRTRVFLEM
jgi:hypothetical protein